MITGVPNEAELHQAGVDYLCLAWEDLHSLIDASEYYTKVAEEASEPPGEWVSAHWIKSARRLGTCHALVHQGAEFILRARIAAVSPYLLLEDPSQTSNASTKDLDFSIFKSVDAHKLCRLHDTVCNARLPASFANRFDEMRRYRNVVIHGIPNPAVARSAESSIKDILETATDLIGPASWPTTLRENVNRGPAAASDVHGAISSQLMEQWQRVIDFLSASECRRHVGINGRRKRYGCPDCHLIDLRPAPMIKLATPIGRPAQAVRCIVCGLDSPVTRRRCSKCSDSIFSDDGICLSCGKDDG